MAKQPGRRRGTPAALHEIHPNQRAAQLATFASNLGAEVDEYGGVAFTDSFRTLHFTAHPEGLMTETGEVIASQTALRGALTPPNAVNTSGLLSGTLISGLGLLTFKAGLMTEGRDRQQQSLHFHFERETPFSFGGQDYAALYLDSYERPGYYFSPSVGVTRAELPNQPRRPAVRHDVPPALNASLRQLSDAATRAMLTPALRTEAALAEIRERLTKARTRQQEIEAEIHALTEELRTAAPGHQRAA